MRPVGPHQSYLPLRAWLLAAVAAVVLLLLQDGAFGEVFSLLLGFMPLGADGSSYLHTMLGRAAATFAWVSVAAIFGWATALCLTLLGGFTGKGGLKVLVWSGRLLGNIPPMAWTLALLVVLIQRWSIPVETLFPYAPPAEMDNALLRMGRHVWTWMLPACVLALPACGMMLSVLAHRLEMLVTGDQMLHLQARGLGRTAIVHQHFLPYLMLDLVRHGRATLPLLLGLSVPVENILGFDGLGGFAGQMLLTHEFPKALPAAIYLGGWMFMLWFGLLGLLEKRSPAVRVMPAYPEGESRALICAVAGAVLLLGLLLAPNWMPQAAVRQAHLATWSEILFVLQAVGVACVVVLISMPLWQGWDRVKPQWNFGLVSPAISESILIPVLLLSATTWLDVSLAAMGVGMVLSLGGMALLRAQAQELSTRRMVEASAMLGENTPGVLKHHLLRYLLPSLANWALRMMATLLLWMSIVHWFLPGAADGSNLSWGA
ncbi:MAG TPA: hypothetical protein VLE43_01415, partial [Candidatus Saccharimonadia bacterium]|nr:hypothetical protein [Candidatus Saccharimonadia bacterium]